MNLKKIKMNAFAQESNSEISDANLPIQNKKKRISQNMFAGCTKWPSQETNCEGPNLPLLEHNAMNFGCRCGSSYVHFHVLGVRHLWVRGVVFARRRNRNSQRRQSRRSQGHVQPQIQNHALVTVTVCMSTPVRRKQSVGTASGCLRILMNKIEFQKSNSSPKFGRDKKLAGIHKVNEKPHPNRSIELQSNPAWRTNAMTRTCDSTNRINQLRLATQLASHSKTVHYHECSRSPANTITSNSEPKTIIQNESTSPLRNKNVDETRMFPCQIP